MRPVLIIGALFPGSGAAQAAPDLSFPLGTGSDLYWTSAYEGGSDRFKERLIAENGDVQIFRTDNEFSEGAPSDYFALFSGIYYATCDLEMPTAEERAALEGLWPLTPGNQVEIKSGDGAKIEVGEPTEFFLMGKSRPAHIVTGKYFGEEESSETLIVLNDVRLTVGINWQDDGKDSVTLVTKPDAVASTNANTDLIGNCADLLKTQTDEN
jgi:hypothetical protein